MDYLILVYTFALVCVNKVNNSTDNSSNFKIIYLSGLPLAAHLGGFFIL